MPVMLYDPKDTVEGPILWNGSVYLRVDDRDQKNGLGHGGYFNLREITDWWELWIIGKFLKICQKHRGQFHLKSWSK